MTVAPLADSAITTVNGISPFTQTQDGVVGYPNNNLIRSFWTYNEQVSTVQALVDSMKRVGTYQSGLEAGLGGQPPADLIALQCNQNRDSKMNSRFYLYQEVLRSPDRTGLQGPPAETHFFGVIAPISGLVEPKDVKLCELNEGLTLPLWCTSRSGNYQLNTYSFDDAQRINAKFLEAWYPTGVGFGNPPKPSLNGTILPYDGVDNAITTLFTTDGRDGSAPLPLALGRTPQQQIDYIAANPTGVYVGFAFVFHDVGDTDLDDKNALITLSVGHSIAPVNG